MTRPSQADFPHLASFIYPLNIVNTCYCLFLIKNIFSLIKKSNPNRNAKYRSICSYTPSLVMQIPLLQPRTRPSRGFFLGLRVFTITYMDLAACCPRTFLFHVSRSRRGFEPVHSALPFIFFSVKAGADASVWEWALVWAVNSLLMDTDVVSFFSDQTAVNALTWVTFPKSF